MGHMCWACWAQFRHLDMFDKQVKFEPNNFGFVRSEQLNLLTIIGDIYPLSKELLTGTMDNNILAQHELQPSIHSLDLKRARRFVNSFKWKEGRDGMSRESFIFHFLLIAPFKESTPYTQGTQMDCFQKRCPILKRCPPYLLDVHPI